MAAIISRLPDIKRSVAMLSTILFNIRFPPQDQQPAFLPLAEAAWLHPMQACLFLGITAPARTAMHILGSWLEAFHPQHLQSKGNGHMEFTKGMLWHPQLSDPKGDRSARNRNRARLGHEQRTKAGGITMVIDKGIGSNAYADFLETASPYVDCIKFGFGTAVLYSDELLLCKTALARNHGIAVMTGGTCLKRSSARGCLFFF